MKFLWALFFTFFKIGAFTIGGGLVMLPIIRRVAVEEKQWLSEEEMVDCFAVCQSLPGVPTINSAIYIGKKTRGMAGAVFAGFGVVLPSFIAMICICLFLNQITDLPYVRGAIKGITAAATGLVFVAAVQMGRQAIKGKAGWFIALASFSLIAIVRVSAVWAILFGAAAGCFFSFLQLRRVKKGG